MNTRNNGDIPGSLKKWFVIHFLADTLFGIPLLLFPVTFLSWFGWSTIDPFTARLVGAALLGIGIESLLMRNYDVETYRAMLTLKIIWASSAIVGITLSMVNGAPIFGWLILAVFVLFWMVWVYYYRLLNTITT